MKVSIAWVFDHIDVDWKSVDIENLINKFNKTTAEIETWQKISIDINQFTLAEVVSVSTDQSILRSQEWNAEITLPAHNDVRPGQWYLIKKSGSSYDWVTMAGVGGNKELLLPTLHIDKALPAEQWKKKFEREDIIVDIDNKSITHRPDLWGHRGMAREIAAILDVALLPIESFVAQKEIIWSKKIAPSTASNPFSITIHNADVCKRFAGLYFPEIAYRSSLLWMATRLSRVDSRPINALVDLTNYVMFDLGQPMHAFDAEALQEKTIVVRRAHAKEKLTMLDGDTLELTTDDVVVADGKTAMSLAGVMGGENSGISSRTKSVLLESANFDGTTIRRTSARHKKRTESSMRFAKSLDPNQNTDAILRFIKLLNDTQIPYAAAEHIMSVGVPAKSHMIDIPHAFIEQRIGVFIERNRVKKILEQLGCTVELTDDGYTITVPTWRSTKDISMPEDIVEEVGRFFGYDNITPVLPSMQLSPAYFVKTFRKRTIKRLLSYGFQMHELYNYSFYDESFLRVIAWEPSGFVSVKNPVSANYTRLVTSLQPYLFKAIHENVAHYDQLRFFEWGRTWSQNNNQVVEQQILSGIIFDQIKGVDFYDAKLVLERLFAMLDISVSWHRQERPRYPWLAPFQTAIIKHEDIEVGIAGVVDEHFVQRLCPAGGMFVFELNGDFLLSCKSPLKQFTSVPKYPAVTRDISILAPLAITVAELTKIITGVDERIEQVTLIDFFTKSEWEDQKSLTFSLAIRDPEKTLTNEEVDIIWLVLIEQLKKQGATIR